MFLEILKKSHLLLHHHFEIKTSSHHYVDRNATTSSYLTESKSQSLSEGIILIKHKTENENDACTCIIFNSIKHCPKS